MSLSKTVQWIFVIILSYRFFKSNIEKFNKVVQTNKQNKQIPLLAKFTITDKQYEIQNIWNMSIRYNLLDI